MRCGGGHCCCGRFCHLCVSKLMHCLHVNFFTLARFVTRCIICLFSLSSVCKCALSLPLCVVFSLSLSLSLSLSVCRVVSVVFYYPCDSVNSVILCLDLQGCCCLYLGCELYVEYDYNLSDPMSVIVCRGWLCTCYVCPVDMFNGMIGMVW